MPIYDYGCAQGHVTELVRPIGTAMIPCPTCGERAFKSEVHHFDVVAPTVDTRGMYRRFTEAVSEREDAYGRAEADLGQPLPRPDDWAVAKARAAAMAYHGEIDVAQVKRASYVEKSGPQRLTTGGTE